MTFTTQREIIRGVAKRWKDKYCRCGDWDKTPYSVFIEGQGEIGRDKKTIWDSLSALDLETSNADEVNRIIGNTAWTFLDCDECGQPTTAVLNVGDRLDCESRLCRKCVDRAATLEWPAE